MTVSSTASPAKPIPFIDRLRFRPEYLVSLLLVAVMVSVAEYAAQREMVSSLILPAPSLVFRVLVEGIADGYYLGHLGSTLYAMLAGFALSAFVAITIAGILASSETLERILTPFIVALQSMPKIAIAPLIVLWFGFGDVSKIVVVAVVCFFPMMVNALQGLKIRERDHFELMQSLGANRWQLFANLRLLHAVPYMFAGLHLGIIFALIGTVVAEFVGTASGIGYALLQSKAQFDVAGVYACLVLLMILGVTLNAITRFIERRAAYWIEDVSRAAA